MIRTATRSDLPAIRELLALANDAPYDIRAVAEEKVLGHGFSGAPRVRLFEEEGQIRGVAVSCGKYLRILAVDRRYRRRGIGSELLHDSGATVVAAEPGNYFTPGVVESDAGAMAFFLASGYRQSAATWNLSVRIRDSGFGDLQSRIPDPESLLPFIERHFGPIWAFEASRAAAAFYLPDLGFAVVEANNRGLGTFGPTGVTESARGRGHGKKLLAAALDELGRRGYRKAIIPWTDALHFYGKSCGAEPAHRFLTLTR